MTKKLCVFCGGDGKITGEHVFPDWIRKAIGDDSGAHYSRRKGDGAVEQWHTFAYTTEVRDVCKACNEGWMSEIEAAVSNQLAPMILEGASATLGSAILERIATWTILRALVIQMATGPHEVPNDYYRLLERLRAPLPSSVVWLGCLEGTDANTALFLGATLDTDAGPEPDGYVATFAVGKLIARVFILTPGRGNLGAASNGAMEAALSAIWPNVKEVIWPAKTLDFEGFSELVGVLPTAEVASN